MTDKIDVPTVRYYWNSTSVLSVFGESVLSGELISENYMGKHTHQRA